MSRSLDAADLDAALTAGLLLSAGGSGRHSIERHRRFGEAAFEAGGCSLVPPDALDPDAGVLVATGVGAPGFSSPTIAPEDAYDAARALIDAARVDPVAVIPGHVPGTYAWYLAARLGLGLMDAATNGRGHPTVKLGGMGLASSREVAVFQACANRHAGLQVVARGGLMETANVMRASAIQCGGLVMSVRGPFTASFVRSNGALGAISFQLDLGRAMLSAPRGVARVDAAVAHLDGDLLDVGSVYANDVAYRDGFDVGSIVVQGASQRLILGVYNEYMTVVDADGRRLAAFPDLIASIDPDTGDPLAIAELTPGRRVAVIAVPRAGIPLGAGVFDPAAYDEIELALGTSLLPVRETADA